jgi:hypothetical protein
MRPALSAKTPDEIETKLQEGTARGLLGGFLFVARQGAQFKEDNDNIDQYDT